MISLKKMYETVFGSANDATMKNFQPLVSTINALEVEYEALTDEQIQEKTTVFKKQLADGKSLNEILPEAFATVREAGKRVLGMRHYDVQLIGGIALHRGIIAEMRTGEGKTLVATLPTYLNALEGKGVHVITVNDYLAKRDAVWMGQIYDFLGLSVGIVQGQRVSFLYDTSFDGSEEGGDIDVARDQLGSFKIEDQYLRPCSRKDAYRADITYGTNNEYGFDYLRDNMVQDVEEMVMRPGEEMHYAVIDEIDSILIDEARTPLIISAPAEAATEQYYTFAKIVKTLKEEDHYNVDEKMNSATLTADGITVFEKTLGVENIYAEGGMRIVHHVEQALKAEMLFKRDKEYVVEENEVVIIDEFTGRKMPGRRYSEGLHQAIEAKEGLSIQQESKTLATITFQNLFRMYTKLSGMTGTAITEEEEFGSIYQLDVLVIPTNKEDKRVDRTDRIYKNDTGKNKAILEKIKECKEKGQPILVGTISVEKNEVLSHYLSLNNITHEILNAKNHEREGEIVANAGKTSAVTLATNMAGRGVDIKLGGADATKEEEQRVIEAGGLFVLGTERHESRRIDNQLRGRSARQGDPGETQFFVSTQDDLMRIFGGERLQSVMTRLKVPEDMPIEQNMITKMLEGAQKKVESHHYDTRKHLLEYDDILNKQRHIIYQKRREILDLSKESEVDEKETEGGATSLKEVVMNMIEQEIMFVVSFHTNVRMEEGKQDDEWNIQEIYETMHTICTFTEEEKRGLLSMGNTKESKFDAVQERDRIVQFLLTKASTAYTAIEEHIASQGQHMDIGEADKVMRAVEKQILLRSVDTLWVDHLVEMTYLRTGIGLRGYGQRDPLIEYKKESFGIFNRLQENIQKEVVYSFFKVGVGLQIAPTIMAEDSMILKGAKKTTESEALQNKDGGPGTAKKKKMSKKERKRSKNK
ncbi:MAG: preprotein translocase subunit SecA [Candidatus Magasanikbacteria bacterium]|jgi:preprotein translocase subunit SecA|nr:preprotein translocase subunit SecA [Candidatus Magasanikbacteria bacterium]MBT5820439.1 preprotein translocase subunit SecA [Candidatus Magasanikbacteria bacterium]MBT6294457.1 preprotein translocase subunit SecA [Candidatus Magasanikbacteria bacterium]